MSADSISYLTAMRANPGLVAALLLCVGPALVLSFIAVMMRLSGASLRPIFFIGGLFLPVVVPFGIGQLVIAHIPAPDTPAMALPVRDGQFLHREDLFGPGVSLELVRNAKSDLPGILEEAEVAEVGITMSGETVLIAQFPGDAETNRAASAYHRSFQLTNTSGDQEKGWHATRMQGDYVEMLRTERQLFVWSGLSKEAAAARRAASNLQTNFPAIFGAPLLPLFPTLQPLGRFFAPTGVKIAGISLLVGVYGLWFFKGIAWSASIQAASGVPIAPQSELVSRLLAINNLDVPFIISTGDAPNELIADWRYGNQKWIDLAIAHGMKKTHRIRLALDEAAHVVRAIESSAEYDWSTGQRIVFFQQERQTVLGLQVDDTWRLKPVASYTYKFDINEMKSPIVTTIIRSGWIWRPSAW